ncbi:MAG: hypothetical protein ACI4AM_01175 [Muribaculaceae bacterium]
MNKLKLIDALSCSEEEDVLIEIAEQLYEIDGFGHEDAAFDGFDTAYPEAITIKVKKDESDTIPW